MTLVHLKLPLRVSGWSLAGLLYIQSDVVHQIDTCLVRLSQIEFAKRLYIEVSAFPNLALMCTSILIKCKGNSNRKQCLT